jgi:quinolinate synthase
MKKITLEKILESLETMTPEVKVPEDIRLKAADAVERMLVIG